ncbi:MAG: NAD(FAD)-dependent dehydrogenase, partial [Chitinophagaceae bacterium]
MTTIVIGGNFAGFTAALELKRKSKAGEKIIVIDKSSDFLFIPSLIWVPFRRREVKDITIPKAEIFRKRGVEFIEAEALTIDPHTQIVKTTKGDLQ